MGKFRLIVGTVALAGAVLLPAGPAAAGAAAAAGPVALTFDDGPHAIWTPRVLDVLAARGVTATFCLVGTQVQRNPALVRRIVAEGHRLCNHSMNHADMSTWTPAQIEADLTATNAAIRAAAPGAAIPYFRAPYGAWGQSGTVAASLGMKPTGWSVDTRDWSRPGTKAIIGTVYAQLDPGGVVLMHDGGGDRDQTVDAVSVLIPALRAGGWSFGFPATS